MIERGGEQFKYWKDLQARFRELKGRCTVGVPVNHSLLLDVYQRSPHVPFNLHHIIYKRVPGYGDVHAYGYSLDGQQTTNPIKHAYGTRQVSPEQEAIKHLRGCVDDQRSEYRQAMAGQVCDDCQSRPGMDADHILPFRHIVRDWIKEEDIALADLVFSGFSTGNQITDPALHDSWVLFHLEQCSWQWLCKQCHVKKTNEDKQYD